MLKRVNKEQICCPVVFFEEIWGGKYPAGPRASCLMIHPPCLLTNTSSGCSWVNPRVAMSRNFTFSSRVDGLEPSMTNTTPWFPYPNMPISLDVAKLLFAPRSYNSISLNFLPMLTLPTVTKSFAIFIN